jgi:hypothetical protein
MVERFCISDQEAGKIIQALCKIKSGPELKKMEKTQRNIYLKKLKDEYNLSIRQIARLTGLTGALFTGHKYDWRKLCQEPGPLVFVTLTGEYKEFSR